MNPQQHPNPQRLAEGLTVAAEEISRLTDVLQFPQQLGEQLRLMNNRLDTFGYRFDNINNRLDDTNSRLTDISHRLDDLNLHMSAEYDCS